MFSFSNIIIGIPSWVILMSFISIILALVIKKEPKIPNLNNDNEKLA